jgi:hypothetical protein
MIQLTETQLQLLAQIKEEPIQLLNPRTGETYVLIKQSAFEKIKSLLDLDDYDPDEGAAYVNEIMAEDDANDPLLESYQKYAERP